MSLKDFRRDTLATLWLSPCTLEELHERDFVKHLTQIALDALVRHLIGEGLIYETKSGVLKAYKEAAKRELVEYEIEFH